MKKVLLIAILAPFASTVIAQEKFTGIGIFQIGSDTSIVYEFAKSFKNKVKIYKKASDASYMHNMATNSAMVKNKTIEPFVYKYEYDGKDRYVKTLVSQCPEISEFHITKYDVSGITITGIKLRFFKNKLISFSSNYNKEISNAMTSKYGAPHLEVKEKEYKCEYSLTGIEKSILSKTYINKWQNGEIEAISKIGDDYDRNCKKIYKSSFYYSLISSDSIECSQVETTQKNDLSEF